MGGVSSEGLPLQSELEYVRLATAFVAPLKVLASGYKQFDLAAFEEDPRRLAGPVALQRQIESIESAVRLSEAELGHMAVAFIRASCEELIWLRYLYTLSRDDARSLLFKMNTHDSGRSVQAQRDYAGGDAMLGMGWPPEFLDHLDELVESNRADLKEIAKNLGWPGAKPNLQWLADSVNKGSFYAYLYAATSRASHFSPAEIFRRLWFESRSGPITVGHPAHRMYITNFTCDTLLRICVMTMAELAPRTENDPEAPRSGRAGLKAVKKLGKLTTRLENLGMVPLITAAEFNFLQGPIPD